MTRLSASWKSHKDSCLLVMELVVCGKRIRRTVPVILVLLVLTLWWYWSKTGHVTSAITCKNRIAQIVLPNNKERKKFLTGMEEDGGRIEEHFFRFVSTQTKQCFDQVHIGPEEDGGWEVCLYGGVEIKKPCLVYSFGVGFDLRFEKGIEDLLGCEVHAFDPSMSTDDHQYSEKGYFHNIGIDSHDTYAVQNQWKLRKLSSIMKELGHEGKTIDYLKLDVEFSEWGALYDMVKSGVINSVRQLAMEIHTAEMDVYDKPDHPCIKTNQETMAFMMKVLLTLQNSGFSVYYFRPNYRTQYKSVLSGKMRYCCHNLHMINSRHPSNGWKEKH